MISHPLRVLDLLQLICRLIDGILFLIIDYHTHVRAQMIMLDIEI